MRRYLIPSLVLILIGSAWVLAATGGPTGTLKVDTPGMIVKLKAPGNGKTAGKPKEVPVPPGRDVSLPVGEHEVSGILLCAQDKTKQVWSIESNGNLGKLRKIQVAEDKPAIVEGGAPLQVKTSVKVTAGEAPKPANDADRGQARFVQNGRTVTVYVKFVGRSGEEYGPKVMIGRRPAPRPVVRLVDYDGKVLSQGNYSCGGVSGVG